LHEQTPTSSYHEIARAGHLANLDCPAEFNDWVKDSLGIESAGVEQAANPDH
jgi:hypothetical protein